MARRALLPDRASVLAAVLLLSAVAGAQARADAAPDGTIIPTTLCGDFFLVRLVLPGEGDGGLTLLFDTGASHTVVDPDALERIAGKRVAAGRRVTLRDAALGPLTFRRLPVRALELDHIARALRHPMDGILGFPAFRHLLLTLDYPRRQIRYSTGALPEPDGVTILPLSRRDRKRPWIRLDLDGREEEVLVDSGSATALILRPSPWLEWEFPPRLARSSMRIRGVSLRQAGRLGSDIHLGGARLHRPVVELTSGTPLVGQPILRHFVLTFDQKRWRMRLAWDGSGPILLPPVRGTGALLAARREGMEIVQVLPDTPASRLGLKEGDRVLGMDGRPMEEHPCGVRLNDLFQDRESVRLTLAGGDAPRQVDVPLVDLIP